MKRLLVNDCLTCIPQTRTFWHDLEEWFDMIPVLAPYDRLAAQAGEQASGATLIVRNASYFPPIEALAPQVALLQDIFTEGPMREMQFKVIESASTVVFNSLYTAFHYSTPAETRTAVIPLPVDFSLFEPGNPMGLQQALSLPDGCVCWIGASLNSAGRIKGYDIFLNMVRANPDIPFVGVFKDAAPEYGPPNLRTYARLSHDELVRVIGACRVGLCTSRTESQHLAGIEMGACGLPMVAPPTGCYWKRADLPGLLVNPQEPLSYTAALRAALAKPLDERQTRQYWQKEFDRKVVRAAWKALIEEVECSGAS